MFILTDKKGAEQSLAMGVEISVSSTYEYLVTFMLLLCIKVQTCQVWGTVCFCVIA